MSLFAGDQSDYMVTHPYLRVDRIPLRDKYSYKSNNVALTGDVSTKVRSAPRRVGTKP